MEVKYSFQTQTATIRFRLELHGPRSKEFGPPVTELSLEAQDLSHVLVHVVNKQKNIKVWLKVKDTTVFQADMRGAPRQTPDLPDTVFQ